MEPTVDVVIVGGGLVGCSLAVALAGASRRVLLLEAVAPRDAAPAWDERCIGLNAASHRILEALGAWRDLAPAAEPILSTHVSERGRFGSATFTAAEAGLDALGYNTPLRAINDVLWTHARAAANVEVRCPARLERLEVEQGGVAVTIAAAGATETLRTRLVVAADGAKSAVRELLGVGAQTRDYGQSAIVTAVRPRHAHAGVAYERFLPTGPLAVLPKPDDADGHACSLVWTVPTADLEGLLALSDADFLARAQDLFGERLGAFRALGRRQAYPLSRVLGDTLRQPRTVFIGNAAQSLHPVAAQGFNLGLRDAATLAELLDGAADPGAETLLAEYEARRGEDRRRVSDFTDGLVRVFSNTVPGLAALRHFGLVALELRSPAREAVLRQNLGFGGRVPRLARS
ncbi:MAG TPA: 2-octaprenyl-6-methoxyphenyl hydroxylase [Nevskiaceae bacterium]|nr:2-octaprenyl-6-methoxyphenyl hydroxylase [Nevskiaceae bacterium]